MASNLSDIPSMNDEILNEKLKIEVAQVIEMEKTLKNLVEKRDLAKSKADKVEELRRKEMGDSMITTLLDLIESVRKVELEIGKTKENLKVLETEDPHQVSKDYNSKLDTIRRRLSSTRKEREAKEVICKQLLVGKVANIKMERKDNQNVQSEVIDGT
ncbi:unnamed protein product [Bursaphelenchus xylophilus]|uniref:(pine wood nematode) hypothetical protein n=1 Tax=Bursaphelenchus xylophilus TaxID=6326 RepID=A0A1I7RSQ6_BURXY|nr:unnamed protein product [Bursaphelenchus xylophilus]CAG9122836.1 unnamed protein product [Bursaphelenchus xylophilus]